MPIEARFGGVGHYSARAFDLWGPTQLLDDERRLVAMLSGPGRPISETWDTRWRVSVEHDDHGWDLVFRAPGGGRVARSRPRWVPNRYGIVLGTQHGWELHKHMLHDQWTVTDQRGLVHVEIERRRIDWRVDVQRAPAGRRAELLVLMALETIRIDGQTPGLGTPVPY